MILINKCAEYCVAIFYSNEEEEHTFQETHVQIIVLAWHYREESQTGTRASVVRSQQIDGIQNPFPWFNNQEQDIAIENNLFLCVFFLYSMKWQQTCHLHYNGTFSHFFFSSIVFLFGGKYVRHYLYEKHFPLAPARYFLFSSYQFAGVCTLLQSIRHKDDLVRQFFQNRRFNLR